mmetsp:Transcript_22553/g.50185  ORF Transcript_22553/g.50185 Transcript_22553/m.50185 type:complete len:91 (-) Transcript_22553:54-326(-)
MTMLYLLANNVGGESSIQSLDTSAFIRRAKSIKLIVVPDRDFRKKGMLPQIECFQRSNVNEKPINRFENDADSKDGSRTADLQSRVLLFL